MKRDNANKSIWHSGILLLSYMILLISACEKDITVDLPQPELKIVVDGAIETGGTPYVLLSKNAPYFAPVDTISLSQYLVHNAIVTVSDGIKTDTLKEWFKTGYYAGSGIIGEEGKYYRLDVTAEGKKLWAITKIPVPKALDSAVFQRESADDTIGRFIGHLSDPDSIGNYYRVMTRRMNTKYYVKNIFGKMAPPDYYPSFGSYDDRLFNGKKFEFRISRGSPANQPDEGRDRNRFKVGDTVSIKWISITKETYDFWRTLDVTVNNNGNPFAAPVTIKSNIQGQGLGAWSGYGPTYLTVIAK